MQSWLILHFLFEHGKYSLVIMKVEHRSLIDYMIWWSPESSHQGTPHISQTALRMKRLLWGNSPCSNKSALNFQNYLFDPTHLTEGDLPNDRGCRVCGKIGHFAKECPKVLAKKQRWVGVNLRCPKKNQQRLADNICKCILTYWPLGDLNAILKM